MNATKIYLSISYRDKKTGLLFGQASIMQSNKVYIAKVGKTRKYFAELSQAMNYIETLKLM